jgi:hypothetical protein
MITAVAGKGLNFKCQGKRVTEYKPVRVRLDHNVAVKLQNGSLVKYVKPIPPAPPKPVVEEVKPKKKIYNKEL